MARGRLKGGTYPPPSMCVNPLVRRAYGLPIDAVKNNRVDGWWIVHLIHEVHWLVFRFQNVQDGL